MRLEFYLGHYDQAYEHYAKPAGGHLVSGGPSTAVRGLTQALAEQGHDISIVAHGHETIMFRDGPVSVQVFKRPQGKAPFMVSRDLLRHIQDIANTRDALVLNGIFHPDLLAISIAARRAGLPYIIAPHDPYHPALFKTHSHRKHIYWLAIERRLLQQSAAIQVLSSTHEKHLRALNIDRPVITVPNGYDIDPLQPSLPHCCEQGEVTLGYLGRLDAWHKGIDVLLEGFAQVRLHHPEVRLILQGPDWGDTPMLEGLVSRLRLNDVVEFRAPDPTPAPAIIAGWDALIAPSRFDGFPFTVLEAMVAARPVICSFEAGVVEHVLAAGCGIGIEPTMEGVEDGILELLARRSEWSNMGLSGHRYLLTDLNWSHIAERAARSYRSALSAPDLRRDTVSPHAPARSTADYGST